MSVLKGIKAAIDRASKETFRHDEQGGERLSHLVDATEQEAKTTGPRPLTDEDWRIMKDAMWAGAAKAGAAFLMHQADMSKEHIGYMFAPFMHYHPSYMSPPEIFIQQALAERVEQIHKEVKAGWVDPNAATPTEIMIALLADVAHRDDLSLDPQIVDLFNWSSVKALSNLFECHPDELWAMFGLKPLQDAQFETVLGSHRQVYELVAGDIRNRCGLIGLVNYKESLDDILAAVDKVAADKKQKEARKQRRIERDKKREIEALNRAGLLPSRQQALGHDPVSGRLPAPHADEIATLALPPPDKRIFSLAQQGRGKEKLRRRR